MSSEQDSTQIDIKQATNAIALDCVFIVLWFSFDGLRESQACYFLTNSKQYDDQQHR